MIRIRLATDEDLDDVLEIERECFPTGSGRDVESWDRWQWWIAEDSEGPCGFAAAVVVEGSDQCYLALAGVSARARGQGLQRRLIRVREAWARGRCCGECITYTATWNHASANNLIRCGYRLYEPEDRWGFGDALYWLRLLVEA